MRFASRFVTKRRCINYTAYCKYHQSQFATTLSFQCMRSWHSDTLRTSGTSCGNSLRKCLRAHSCDDLFVVFWINFDQTVKGAVTWSAPTPMWRNAFVYFMHEWRRIEYIRQSIKGQPSTIWDKVHYDLQFETPCYDFQRNVILMLRKIFAWCHATIPIIIVIPRAASHECSGHINHLILYVQCDFFVCTYMTIHFISNCCFVDSCYVMNTIVMGINATLHGITGLH